MRDDQGPSTGSVAKAGSARGRIIAAASRRFYADGVGATGVDTITSEAGVAKMSLYNNFSSKAELVSEYLEARHREWLDLYRRRVADASGPRERVLAVFDAYTDHAGLAYERGFRGCGLLNAAAELPAGEPARAIVRRHKEEVENELARHLGELLPGEDARVRDTAQQLAFLLEGAMARAGLEGDDRCLRAGRAAAATLVDGL